MTQSRLGTPALILKLTAVLSLGLLSGCGMSSLTSGIGGGMFGSGSSKSDGKVTEEQMLTAAKADSSMGVGGDIAGGCPRFQVWPRDHHVTIYEPGRVGDGLAVMHKGEITKTARECQVEPGRVTVKFGFSGRVLLGPRGKGGTVVAAGGHLCHRRQAREDRHRQGDGRCRRLAGQADRLFLDGPDHQHSPSPRASVLANSKSSSASTATPPTPADLFAAAPSQSLCSVSAQMSAWRRLTTTRCHPRACPTDPWFQELGWSW